MYNIIIPSVIITSPELSPSAKLLYGEILVLSAKKGYCFADNAYFAERFNVKRPKTVSDWIGELEKHNFVRIEYTYAGARVSERRLFGLVGIDLKSAVHGGGKTPSTGAEKRPNGGGKTPTTRAEKRPDNIDKDNIKKNNNAGPEGPRNSSLFFLNFSALIKQYEQDEIITPLAKDCSDLFKIILNNLGLNKVNENADGVIEDKPENAGKLQTALSQIKTMLDQCSAEKASFEASGKKYFKKSLKRLLLEQTYTKLPKTKETPPNPPKTGLNQELKDWKVEFCEKLREKGVIKIAQDKLEQVIQAFSYYLGKYYRGGVDQRGALKAGLVSLFQNSTAQDFGDSSGADKGELAAYKAVEAWSKTEQAEKYKAWAAQRRANKSSQINN